MTIINIIRRYYQNMKIDQLPRWYEQVITEGYEIRKAIKKFAKHRYRQSGGDIDNEKLQRLRRMVDEITGSIDPTVLRQRLEKMNIEIKSIQDELDKIRTDIDVTGIVNDDQLLNNLTILKVSIEKASQAFNINMRREGIILKPPVNITQMMVIEETSRIEEVIRTVRDRLAYVKDNETIRETEKEREMTEMIALLNEQINNLRIRIDELNKMRAFFDKRIENLEGRMNMGIVKDDLVKVQPINVVIEAFVRKVETVAYERVEPEKQEYFDRVRSFARELSENLIVYNAPYTSGRRVRKADLVILYNSQMMIIQNSPYYPSELRGDLTIVPSYFDGNYNVQVRNNILRREDAPVVKIGHDILSGLISTEPLPDMADLTDIDIKKIYAPLFIKKDGVGSVTVQEGGRFEETEKELLENLTRLGTLKTAYSTTAHTLISHIDTFNKLHIDFAYFTMFMILIATNQLLLDGYVIYQYINRGIVQYYQRIIIRMYEQITGSVNSFEVQYLRKNHRVVITMLKNFLSKISNNMGIDDIIIIAECSDEIRRMFHLLNHFKPIMESYMEMSMSNVNIYARINDWNTGSQDTWVNINEEDILNVVISQRKTFLSQRELQFHPKKADYEYNEDDPYKQQKMTLNYEACMNSSGNHNMPGQESGSLHKNIRFTEVFDSFEYPQNDIISKYMAIETQLSKGKGVMLMTYGYSGVGKTHTLFGKSKDGDHSDGILQSTLSGINGLNSLMFRVFELHGYGFQYPHYWEENHLHKAGDAKSPKWNVAHWIYHYLIKLNGNNLDLEGTSSSSDNPTCDGVLKYDDNKHTAELKRTVIINDKNFDMYISNGTSKENDESRRELLSQIRDSEATHIQLLVERSQLRASIAIGNSESKEELMRIEEKIREISDLISEYNTKLQELKNTIEENRPENLKPMIWRDDSYISIGNPKEVFRTFDSFIETVDNHRRSYCRIRATPNNPESSRSILIYDFQLVIEGNPEPVSFIIVDLPGREDILKTYVEKFTETTLSKSLGFGMPTPVTNVQYHKPAILSSMAINPLFLPVFVDGNYVWKIFQESDQQKDIMSQLIPIYWGGVTEVVGEEDHVEGGVLKFKLSTGNTDVAIITTLESGKVKNTFPLSDLVRFDGMKMLDTRPEDGAWGLLHGQEWQNSPTNRHYIDGLIGIAVINRLITLQRFDELYKIFKSVSENYFNKDIIEFINTIWPESDGDKSQGIPNLWNVHRSHPLIGKVLKSAKSAEYIGDTPISGQKLIMILLEKEYFVPRDDMMPMTSSNLRKLAINRMTYNYYLTPYEGIYINENINGLIYYLVKNFVESDSSNIDNLNKMIPKQTKYPFKKWHKNIRDQFRVGWEQGSTRTTATSSTKHSDTPGIEVLKMSEDGLKMATYISQNKDKDSDNIIYDAQRIFNPEEPVIGRILKYYLTPKEDAKVKDFKIFYLFSNRQSDLKCENQLRLLEATESFIKAIVL